MLYRFGTYAFDSARYELRHAGQPVPLRPQACELLAYLLRHRDRVVPKEELLAQVWPGQYVGDAVLHACVLAVRTALHDTGRTPSLLRTVRGRGCRFVAPVEVRDVPLDAPLLALPSVKAAPPLLAEAPRTLPAGAETPATAVVAAEPQAEGEYKLVSVLCCGLAEAPALAARLGAEGLYRLLQTVVGLAQEVLQPYAGTLLPPTSEGITAVFGAPVAQEDHARRAVLAALELHQRLRQHPALRAQLASAGLAVRMGVHSGLVVVGEFGQDAQRVATVVGVPAHLARRLQEQAPPGTILLSAATYQLVHAEVRVTPGGSLTVDGSPMLVYTLQRLLGRQAGVAGRGPRVASPFVGWTRELALLHDCLAAAMAGQGQVVGLVGEPGMGKTRLVTEFCRSLAGESVTVYVGQCLSYGQAAPYLPVRDLLRQVCGIGEGDAAAACTAAVQQRLHASGITGEEDGALLLQLLDLPMAPECLARLSPQARQARTFALLRHLVLHAAQRQPLVVVAENLHWSDATSAAWLASLVERLTDAAVLLLGTYRPGYQPPWGAHSAAMQVALPPLQAQDSWVVVQAVLGPVSLPEERLREMVVHAGGNPFFLEELAWHAREQAQMGPLGAVPETVHAVLAARMDQLPPEAKRLLQVAAVIGPEVPLALLHAITEFPDEVLYQHLARLQTAEFLYETRLVPEHIYAFKHVLTHEVAYGSLLQEQRRALHACTVEALERLAPDRLVDQVEQLAHHALWGELWDKAVTYYRQAGTKAAAHSAYHEAVAYFEQAVVALRHLPESHLTHEQAIDLRFNLRSALLPLSAYGRMAECLCEAQTLAEALGDQRRLGQVLSYMAHLFQRLHEYDRAIESGHRALTLAGAFGDVDLQVATDFFLGHIYFGLGDYRGAVEYFGSLIAALDGDLRYERFGMVALPAVQARSFLAWCLAALGAFTEGITHAEEAVRIAEAVGHPYSLIWAYFAVGRLYLRKGDVNKAIFVYEHSHALCQDANIPILFIRTTSGLGSAYALSGRVAEALPLLEQAVEQATSMRHMVDHSGRIIELSRKGHPGRVFRLLGQLYAHGAPPAVEQAAAHYRQALALAEELGMLPLQAHCHQGLGTLYATTGQREQARIELLRALEMYRAMEMTCWLPQAEAVLAQVSQTMEGGVGLYI